MLVKPPVCGCAVEVAPSEGNMGADVFAAPRELPNRPPSPPVLAGCDVPDGAPEAPPPRPPNKPVDVVVEAPNSGLVAGVPAFAVPPAVGCEPPRLPKSDMSGGRVCGVDCAENNNRVHHLRLELGPRRPLFMSEVPSSRGIPVAQYNHLHNIFVLLAFVTDSMTGF
jgi:hypothetical protein